MSADDTLPLEDDALAAEYVLGTLPYAERLAFESRIAKDRALRDRVMWWQDQMLPLSDAVAAVAPPPALKAAIERRLSPPAQPSASLWDRLGFWRGLTAASFAAMLAMAVVVFGRGFAPDSTTVYITEISGTKSGLRVAAVFNPADGILRLRRTAGQVAGGRDFELWLIAGDKAPVSLGTLPDRPDVSLEVPNLLRRAIEAGAVLAVSDEPDGGSPTGQPTGEVLGVGAVTKI